jgi:Tol biopolymer transport system component
MEAVMSRQVAVVVAAAWLMTASYAASAAATTELISVNYANTIAAGGYVPTVDATGRYVVFTSASPNIVPGDTNGKRDLFLRDRETDSSIRVSVGPTGGQLNGNSFGRLTPSGRFLVFRSNATNVIPGGTSRSYQVYIRDLQAGANERVSVSNTGAPAQGGANAVGASDDGRFVVFTSLGTNLVPGTTTVEDRAYLRDRLTRQTTTLGPPEAITLYPQISPDGRFAAFATAYPIIPSKYRTGREVYLKNLATGRFQIVSRSSTGARAKGNSHPLDISRDGRFVLFASYAANLVPNDTNGTWDVFVRDRQTGLTERVSVSSAEVQANGLSGGAAISDDGRFVAFGSSATNLVPGISTTGGYHGYVRDRLLGTTQRADLSSTGVPANAGAGAIDLSGNGSVLVLDSTATNLSPKDTTTEADVYARVRTVQ